MQKNQFLILLFTLFFITSCSQDDGVDINAKNNSYNASKGDGLETNKHDCNKYQDCDNNKIKSLKNSIIVADHK